MTMKRVLQIRLVKPKDEATQPTPNDTVVEDTVIAVDTLLKNAINHVARAALAYVAVDTVRKVIIAKATNR